MNPANTQPNKEQLEALAFRLIREVESLNGRLNSVKQLISQIENAEFMKSVQPSGNPSADKSSTMEENAADSGPAKAVPPVDK